MPDFGFGSTFAALAAFWLGVLSAVSPCGLATNIAAIAFIGKNVKSPSSTVWSGLFYALGRITTYVVIGMVVVAGLTAVHVLSNFLQTSMNRFLGPLLVLVGMVTLDLLPLRLPETGFLTRFSSNTKVQGIAGAFGIGLVFALAFCPVSAALFFGGLIPLAVEKQSTLLLPFIFGLGTAIPVAAFAVVIGAGAYSLSKLFAAVTAVELWARWVTGVVFVGIGIYFTLVYTLLLFQ